MRKTEGKSLRNIMSQRQRERQRGQMKYSSGGEDTI